VALPAYAFACLLRCCDGLPVTTAITTDTDVVATWTFTHTLHTRTFVTVPDNCVRIAALNLHLRFAAYTPHLYLPWLPFALPCGPHCLLPVVADVTAHPAPQHLPRSTAVAAVGSGSTVTPAVTRTCRFHTPTLPPASLVQISAATLLRHRTFVTFRVRLPVYPTHLAHDYRLACLPYLGHARSFCYRFLPDTLRGRCLPHVTLPLLLHCLPRTLLQFDAGPRCTTTHLPYPAYLPPSATPRRILPAITRFCRVALAVGRPCVCYRTCYFALPTRLPAFTVHQPACRSGLVWLPHLAGSDYPAFRFAARHTRLPAVTVYCLPALPRLPYRLPAWLQHPTAGRCLRLPALRSATPGYLPVRCGPPLPAACLRFTCGHARFHAQFCRIYRYRTHRTRRTPLPDTYPEWHTGFLDICSTRLPPPRF